MLYSEVFEGIGVIVGSLGGLGNVWVGSRCQVPCSGVVGGEDSVLGRVFAPGLGCV